MSNKSGIFDSEISQFSGFLSKKNLKISVIGLGRIGLPTAVAIAKSGLKTVGVDINKKIIDFTNQGKIRVKDEPGLEEELRNVVQSGKLYAVAEIKNAVESADVIIICLPTPLDNNTKTTNYSYLLDGCAEISKHLQKKSLVIIESTVGPGVIEEQVVPVIEKQSGLKAGIDFGLVSCPERANPSTILSDFNKIPRVIGGINEKSTELASKLYEFVFNISIVKVSNCKTANAVKIVENVFRDVNVAFMNEIAIFCDKVGIDVLELLKGCSTKYNFIPHYPGAGVGGPCLPVNPYQLLDSPKAEGLLNIVRKAREINVKMPNYVIDLVRDSLIEAKKSFDQCTFAVLGISYKPNVGDIQLSPVEIIVNELTKLGAKTKIFDPFFSNTTIFSHQVESTLIDAIKNSDCIIIGTAHNQFLEINLKEIVELMKKPAIIIDTRGIVSPNLAKESGFIYRGIGRSSII